jgi:tetratricopeptide (TPR) repeat protein
VPRKVRKIEALSPERIIRIKADIKVKKNVFQDHVKYKFDYAVDDYIELRKKGDKAAEAKEYDESINFYTKAIDINNKYYTALVHLGPQHYIHQYTYIYIYIYI